MVCVRTCVCVCARARACVYSLQQGFRTNQAALLMADVARTLDEIKEQQQALSMQKWQQRYLAHQV